MGLCQILTFILIFIGASFAAAEEKTSVEAFNGETLEMSVLTYQQALDFFEYVQKQKNIPFGLIADGCHVRAQQMSDLAAYKKIDAAKIIIEPPTDAKLIIKSEDGPWLARWDYHIAPILIIKTEAGYEPFVIDPALFDSPVNQTVWLERILRDTPIGENQPSIYFVSRFTFSPGVKDQVFTELPAKLDRNMGGMLSIFSTNLKRMGPYYEKCFLSDPETGQETIGGLPRSQVAGGESFEQCQPAGI